MAQINKPSDYFNTKLYTGNGTVDHAITGVGFAPDWVWIKNRDQADNHRLTDTVRGAAKELYSASTFSEDPNGGLTSFDSDGFTLNTNAAYNTSTENYVSWNWLAGGTASSNTDGSITSSVSANTTSGFSIVSYTGTGVNATVGHGLGVAPKMIIIKKRDGVAYNWRVGHEGIGWGNYLELNTAAASASASTIWQSTAPTSNVFSVGTDTGVNTNQAYIAYCFAEKKGFSKFSSYEGNNSTDGTFVYTGFSPAFVLTKNIDSADHWTLWDNKRENNINPNNNVLYPSTSGAESTSDTTYNCDLLSNGFKWRGTSTGMNGAYTYIYMAFAQNPLVGTNNIPATAR